MRLDRLEYQIEAINNVLEAIKHEDILENKNVYANPIINNTQNIDVKMETGTGKTYVYTRLMHSLKQKFGFYKFIILVPSVPIKEGVKMSIASDDWNKHFRQEFGNQSIHLGVINAGDFDTKKGKRKQIPEVLRSFCDASKAEDKNIQVLLLNDGMLSSSSMSKNDYDSTLFGNVSCPLEGLKAVCPIVIIDEPHRFSKTNKAWKNITEGLCPQLIIRFGATFPIIKGKSIIDYENLVYDLNSIRAFNDGLVKGVHIEYPALPETKTDIVKYKVKHIKKGKTVTFTKAGSSKEYILGIDEDLTTLDKNFSGGVTLENIKTNDSAFLSNALELKHGMELVPQTFTSSYQELILNQAIDAHFIKEKENFYRTNSGENLPRIKTNSLFFIDNISSFRGVNNEKGWLRLKFEDLLTKRIFKEMENEEGEYKEFLQESLKKNEKGEMEALAGYFSEDNIKKSDDAIQDEVDKVLRDKEQSLKFKNKNGKWNICRFFFSKWTLCEGWDNPNVFVIAKLRSSGSEIRKLQEVGRGLRLPFDENGTRVTLDRYNEDFRLTYIIDYSEKEFAKTLVGEINADGAKITEGKISDIILEALVKTGYADNIDKAVGRLLTEGIIDRNYLIKEENIERLFNLLPEESGFKVKNGIITGSGMPDRPKVKLNRENFNKIKELWEIITKRYLIEFIKLKNNEMEKFLQEIFSGDKIFVKPVVEIISENIERDKNQMKINKGGYKVIESDVSIIKYGEFLKRLNCRTSLPISMLHKAIAETQKYKNIPIELFNTKSLENAIKTFEENFMKTYEHNFIYHPLNYKAQTSLYKNGDFVCEMNQTYLGNKIANDIKIDNNRYLYDKVVYDSDIEYAVLKSEIPKQVFIYGKLPRKSIKIPTYTGGTTSPDFVFTINGHKPEALYIYLVVETKSENPRLSDNIAVNAQKKAFEIFGNNIKWELIKDVENFQRNLEDLIKSGAKGN